MSLRGNLAYDNFMLAKESYTRKTLDLQEYILIPVIPVFYLLYFYILLAVI